MPLYSPETFCLHIVKDPVIGIDWGEKKIGLAVSSAEQKVALALQILNRSSWKQLSQDLCKILDTNKVTGIVIGWPLHMSGREGSNCQSVKDFIKNLLVIKDYSICVWDERLSSKGSFRQIDKKKHKKSFDDHAAAFFLQGALDYFHNVRTCKGLSGA